MEYCAITGDGVVASGEIARLGGELRDGLGVGCACLSGLSRKLSVRQGLPQTLPRRVIEKASGFSCVCGLPRSDTSSHKEILLMLELVCKKSRGINHGLCLLGITFYEPVFYIIKLQPFRMPPHGTSKHSNRILAVPRQSDQDVGGVGRLFLHCWFVASGTGR